MTWFYKRFERFDGVDEPLYTVGFFDPSGNWHPESDHTDPEIAAARVAWLNGAQLQDTLDVAIRRATTQWMIRHHSADAARETTR